MRSFLRPVGGQAAEPPRIHPAQKWVWVGIFAVLAIGVTALGAAFITRQPDDLAPVIVMTIGLNAGCAAGFWVVWKQCTIVISQNGVAWGAAKARRYIAWKDATLQIDGLVIVVQSGRGTLKINSAHYAQGPFWQFFHALAGDLDRCGRQSRP